MTETLAGDDAEQLLTHGDLTVEGRLVAASNATLYCSITLAGVEAAAVYKPVAGERPLWDFPTGTLGHRELATFVTSQATGWGIVPPTVWRDGPFGPGMVQLWVTLDSSVDPVELIRRDDAQLRRIAVLDAVVNNGDRKGGHLLPTVAGHIYGIDHGVTFALEPKLRTLLWQWEGRPLTDEARDVLESLARGLSDGGDLRRNLGAHLDVSEIDATRDRVDGLLRAGVHPSPPPDWPPIPWPPF
ncbi:MAG: SCO1664 family protein [Actinomycetota bacterium]|nr:SCO1664 family protein [Actinomycetota bacterium]MDH4353685.1 SCO1664 family protein [Actinomycetota bacterium]MDH5279035.1 SCO1664 family protein [Actinomycetota bacterium]